MSNTPHEYFMPMTMRAWPAAIEFPGGAALTLADAADVPGSAGFIPLYPTIEAMQAAHGLVPFQRIRAVLEAPADA